MHARSGSPPDDKPSYWSDNVVGVLERLEVELKLLGDFVMQRQSLAYGSTSFNREPFYVRCKLFPVVKWIFI